MIGVRFESRPSRVRRVLELAASAWRLAEATYDERSLELLLEEDGIGEDDARAGRDLLRAAHTRALAAEADFHVRWRLCWGPP